MLASVMLKLGTYGIVRICLPLFPDAARASANWIVVLALIGIVYGALVAMVQPNMKRLVAYSSVSHLGFVVLGIFSFNHFGMDGAVYQMLNHGVSTGALFILVGFLYERRHSLEIADYGGVATVAPWLTTLFVITSLASIGLPLLNNFIGEFLIMQGAAVANFPWAIIAALGVILSSVYMLWLIQRTFYGETPAAVKNCFKDLHPREWGYHPAADRADGLDGRRPGNFPPGRSLQQRPDSEPGAQVHIRAAKNRRKLRSPGALRVRI